MSGGDPVSVRAAGPDDLVAVMRLLDGALLEADAGVVRERIDEGAVLVADVNGRPVGALVLDESHVDSVAVSRARRDRGIGSALVECAADRADGPLTAAFDADVRPFYASLGFQIEHEEGTDGRFRGVLR